MISRHNNSKLNTVYGIKFMADAAQTKKVNDYISNDTELVYIPMKLRKNIYFTSRIEAMKAVDYLNSLKDGRYYHIFPTSLESLHRIKDLAENDRAIKKKSPIMYHRMTGYVIYNSADEYISLIENGQGNITF